MEGLMLLTLYLVIALACKLPMSTVDHILITFQFGWHDVCAVRDCFAFRDSSFVTAFDVYKVVRPNSCRELILLRCQTFEMYVWLFFFLALSCGRRL